MPANSNYQGVGSAPCSHNSLSEMSSDNCSITNAQEMDKEEKIIQDNKLIAAFVGLKFIWTQSTGWNGEAGDWDMDIEFPDFFDHDEQLMYLYNEDTPDESLKFHSDWNWLMPVVEKVESLGNSVKIEYKYCLITGQTIAGCIPFNEHDGTKIDATYQAVVQFIQWYNASGIGAVPCTSEEPARTPNPLNSEKDAS